VASKELSFELDGTAWAIFSFDLPLDNPENSDSAPLDMLTENKEKKIPNCAKKSTTGKYFLKYFLSEKKTSEVVAQKAILFIRNVNVLI